MSGGTEEKNKKKKSLSITSSLAKFEMSIPQPQLLVLQPDQYILQIRPNWSVYGVQNRNCPSSYASSRLHISSGYLKHFYSRDLSVAVSELYIIIYFVMYSIVDEICKSCYLLSRPKFVPIRSWTQIRSITAWANYKM